MGKKRRKVFESELKENESRHRERFGRRVPVPMAGREVGKGQVCETEGYSVTGN